MKKSTNDTDLIEGAKNGDEKAFTKLINKYRNSIYYTILKIVNNPNDAEDLTIETFEKVFNSINSYSNTYAFSTWLYKIATNTCIDFIRKKQLNVSIIDQLQNNKNYFIENIQSDSHNPEEHLINKQKIVNLKEVLNQLKPQYRKLIELRYYKEYSYDEIAKELKIPIGTVKAQLYRTKIIIYNILKTKK